MNHEERTSIYLLGGIRMMQTQGGCGGFGAGSTGMLFLIILILFLFPGFGFGGVGY
jgi:hypothetical protein